MITSNKRVLSEVKRFAGVLLLSFLSVYVFCTSCWSFEQIPWITLSYSAVAWLLLFYGNGFIHDYLDNHFSWLHQMTIRLVLGFVAMIGYTILAMYAMAYFFLLVLEKPLVYPSQISGNLWPTLLITSLITAVMLGRSFLFSWRESAINEEKLKRENIQSRFESLKNQLNPHFLFNSLNVLAELVYLDQDKSVQFIQELSGIYRYVLDKREKEVVLVAEELAFLDKYFFLQKIRFQEALQVDIQVSSVESFIPPMALQLLVENAIKHNIVSEEQPLQIRILERENYLEVSNNIQPKKLMEPSSGVGLPNIKERYSFLSKQEVEVVQNSDFFTVRLPLLNIKKHAHTAY